VSRLPLIAIALILAAPLAAAQPPQPSTADGAPELVDRVVAVVDEDPILLSDVERAIALGTVHRQEGESDPELLRRALDAMIEWRLRLHEIARFGFEEAPLAEVDRQLERLEAQYPSDTAWKHELERLHLDEAQVRQILARQLSVLNYVEQRLGPRVFVGVDDIRTYYQDELVPKLRAEGEPVPPIDEVREGIRALLREQRLNAEIDRWTAELRNQADVVDLLDEPPQGLPPAVGTIGPPVSPP